MLILFKNFCAVLIRLYLAAILLFTASSAISKSVKAAEGFRIGAFLAVTGQGAFLGAPALATLKLYVELLNAQGGLLGRPVKLFDYDVGIDAKTAQSTVRRLIEVDRVNLIIGGSTTGATAAVMPIIEQTGIPFIALAESASIIDPVRKWVFKSSQTERMACAKIILDMKRLGILSFGLISGDGGFGRSMRAHCIAQAQVLGLKVVADEVYRSKTRRVAGQLSKIQKTPNVQAVLNVGFGTSPAYVTQNFRRLNFDVPLYQSHGAATQDYLDFAGAAAEGVRLPVAPLLVVDQLASSDPVKRVLDAYISFYKNRWAIAPTVYGAHAFDAIRIAAAAVGQAGSFDKFKIRAQMENLEGYVGASGIVRMTPKNHLGLNLDAFRMVEIQSGEWILVE